MRRALRTTPLIPGEGGWGKRRTGAARVLARSQSLARPQSWHGAGPGRAARELQEQHAKSAATRHAERAWTYVAS